MRKLVRLNPGVSPCVCYCLQHRDDNLQHSLVPCNAVRINELKMMRWRSGAVENRVM